MFKYKISNSNLKCPIVFSLYKIKNDEQSQTYITKILSFISNFQTQNCHQKLNHFRLCIPSTKLKRNPQTQVPIDKINQRNQQLASRIAALNIEVKQRQYRITEKQQKCQQLRESISKSIFVKDIELENQKKLLSDKLTLGKQKVKNLQKKINDIRRQTVIQQEKIPILVQERKKLQQELRIAKMENQGLKSVIINLEQQNEEFRKYNNQLSLKKSSKQPQQKALSQQIQDRIRIIKNLNAKDKVFKKQQSLRLIIKILQDLFFQRKKICFLTTQKHGLKKSLIKKKIFLLTLIRKKYINFVKSEVMSTFRKLLNPLLQEQKCVRILENMRNRREKAKIWRIWRNQTAKAEYILIRKFESKTVIQKIGNTVLKRLVIIAFERLRYFKNNCRTQIALSKMFEVLNKARIQPLRQFLSILSRENYQYQIQKDIQISAQNQSRTLILSRIFYGWLSMMKDKKKDSLTLKFKYFNQLKKISVMKKRNVLNEMLGQTKIRLNEINVKSISFAALKKEMYQVKEKRTLEEKDRLISNFGQLKQDTENRVIIDEQIDKQRALAKVQGYLKRKAKQALAIWRKQCKRAYAMQRICSMISFYSKKSVNYAFSRIQTRRFQKLKLSIKDKIQSCDYSYNYLVEENSHIKEVLDKKSHELEKAKFVTIIRRLVRQEKNIKRKYFYKFLKNGYKFWLVKKSLQNIDHMMKKKLSLVFMFLLKLNKTQMSQLQKIEMFTQKKDNQIENYLLKNSFQALKFCVERNKRMRRALMGVFDRNTELNSYQAYGKIRDQFFQMELDHMQQHRTDLQQKIIQTNQDIETTIQTIEILTERLKNKQQTFRERKVMSIYKFFTRNVKKNVGQYIWRWKNKVDEEKRIVNFVKTLQRKTESIVKTKLFSAIQKTKQQLHKKYLQNKLQKYTHQYEHRNQYFEQFLSTTEQRIAAMEVENQKNQQIINEYQKKTQHMNDVKVESFLRRWGKNICKFAFREWKKQKVEFVKSWERVFNILMIVSVRDSFQTLSTEIRSTLVRDRIKRNLIKVTTKAYRQNIGFCFKLWRNININTKVKQNEQILKSAMAGKQHIEQRLKDVKEKYNNKVNKRINQWKLRRLTNMWRIYTEKKLNNNQKYEQLMKWLEVGYSTEIIGLFRKYKNKSLDEKNTVANFKRQVIIKRARIFLHFLSKVRLSKNTIERLFINKFCYNKIHQLNQQFFSRTKNYQRFKEIQQKDYKTYCIQKVINAFQKKRKGILSQNMRMWKRNMYLMSIEKNLLKRLVRKAMNNRVKDLFYAWKAQTSARNMVIEHTEEGQVKKRKIQIARLKKYIGDFKKEKGLLLENQEGDFVVSPKYQQKKQKELRRSNLLKYKFVSRLILSMNGYEAPVRAWTNLQMFSKLRLKIQRCALMARNRMQRGDLYTGFKIWHNETKQVRRQFQQMQRKDLIRLLNRQKDRMQIQYGKKVEVQQRVQKQLRRYNLLSYQDKRKQRIFAQALFRQARKVKSCAFNSWRERAKELVDFELNDLEKRGNNKLQAMDEEVQDLQGYYRHLEENNRMLKAAVQEALELADMIKRISEERDQLQRELTQSDISCESLQTENQQLNNKLILAQKQAMNLLTLSNNRV